MWLPSAANRSWPRNARRTIASVVSSSGTLKRKNRTAMVDQGECSCSPCIERTASRYPSRKLPESPRKMRAGWML